jgi:phosphatidylglycerophosphate synthase
MKPLDALLDSIRLAIRAMMRKLAKLLNRSSGGRISPNMVTIFGLFMHIPIALLIARERFILAAVLLIIFGLFDTLDGELARLQGRASNAGMLLDASTDRMKEVLLYTGAAYALVSLGNPYAAAWAVAACGASLCVSYVKAKGETAVAGGKLTANEVNRLFADGLFRFEVRMFILVVGLFSGQLLASIIINTVMSTYTALERLVRISRKLDVQA